MLRLLNCQNVKNCGKELTARTLKYSHAAVCPTNENTPPAKSRKKEAATTPGPRHDVCHDESKLPQVVRLRKSQER